MSDNPGSISHLHMMAERCRRVAEELRGEEAETLVDLASRFEARIAELKHAEETVAAEE